MLSACVRSWRWWVCKQQWENTQCLLQIYKMPGNVLKCIMWSNLYSLFNYLMLGGVDCYLYWVIFFLWLQPWHKEVPGSGTGPSTQQWQCQIINFQATREHPDTEQFSRGRWWLVAYLNQKYWWINTSQYYPETWSIHKYLRVLTVVTVG